MAYYVLSGILNPTDSLCGTGAHINITLYFKEIAILKWFIIAFSRHFIVIVVCMHLLHLCFMHVLQQK